MKNSKPERGTLKELVIYEAPDGTVKIDVSLRDETVWLSQAQMVMLFARDQSVTSRHVNAIFNEGELQEKANVQKMHIGSGKPTALYSLDVIISVGYRVSSKRGTQFRIWATQVLRQHLVQGYTIREQRLLEVFEKYDALRKVVALLGRTAGIARDQKVDEAEGLLRVLADYSQALDLLDRYDHQQLTVPKGQRSATFILEYPEARTAIDRIADSQRKTRKSPSLFGQERGDAFRGVLAAIHQTFDGKDLYPSVEEKAAHLLYFTVKDHPFTDGNKRIGAVLFAWYLCENGLLVDRTTGERRLDNAALAALALLVAESRPTEKDALIGVIVNLLAKRLEHPNRHRLTQKQLPLAKKRGDNCVQPSPPRTSIASHASVFASANSTALRIRSRSSTSHFGCGCACWRSHTSDERSRVSERRCITSGCVAYAPRDLAAGIRGTSPESLLRRSPQRLRRRRGPRRSSRYHGDDSFRSVRFAYRLSSSSCASLTA